MSVIFNQSVQILRARKAPNPYGSHPVEDWSDPEVITPPFLVSVQPTGSQENHTGRPGLSTSFMLITPPGTDLDITDRDRVVLKGGWQLDVVGDPARWPDPFFPDQVHHVEVGLESIRG